LVFQINVLTQNRQGNIMMKCTFALSFLAVICSSPSLYSCSEPLPVETVRIQGRKDLCSTVQVTRQGGKLSTDCFTIDASENNDRISFTSSKTSIDQGASLDVYIGRHAHVEVQINKGDIHISGCTNIADIFTGDGNVTVDLTWLAQEFSATVIIEEENPTSKVSAPQGTITFILPETTFIHSCHKDTENNCFTFSIGKTKFISCAKKVVIRRLVTHLETETIFPK
jgi:hypothetical protein